VGIIGSARVDGQGQSWIGSAIWHSARVGKNRGISTTKNPLREEIESRRRRGIHVPDTLPPEAEQAVAGSRLETAIGIAGRCHCAGETAAIRAPGAELSRAKRAEARFAVAKVIKPLELTALREWAAQENLMRDNAEFERAWRDGGAICGSENEVWFDATSQRWWKRNNLSFHITWLEYFHRLALHNWLFPEAAMTLEGFVEHESEFLPIASQPHVCATRGARGDEVLAALQEFGFRSCGGNDYFHEPLGIRVEDLHDENAVLHPCGEIAVLDPAIYLRTTVGWKARPQRSAADTAPRGNRNGFARAQIAMNAVIKEPHGVMG
jgi:hypothetical protein